MGSLKNSSCLKKVVKDKQQDFDDLYHLNLQNTLKHAKREKLKVFENRNNQA